MKLLVITPALVAEERHVEMVRVQSLLARRLKRWLPGVEVESALVLDGAAAELRSQVSSVGEEFNHYEELADAKRWPWGVRNPTERAVRLAADSGCSHILRVIQDTYVFHPELLAAEILRAANRPVIGGHIHHWQTSWHFRFCDEMGLEKRTPLTYVHGELTFAPVPIWEAYYQTLPHSINHYFDDCLFSQAFLQAGGELVNFSPESWQHRHHCEAEESRRVFRQFAESLA